MSSNNSIINTGTIIGNVSQKNIKNYQANGISGNDKNNTDNDIPDKQIIYKYDIAISYASEQEAYVRRVAKILEKENMEVFYAPNREEEFLGKDMITEFYDIYRYESLFVAGFISGNYLKKDITMHEATTALLREKEEKRNCLIPIYFGGARLDKLNSDVHFLDADKLKEVEVADKLKTIVIAYKNKSNRP